MIVVLAALGGATALAEESFEAISRPSKDITMSFTQPGKTAEVFVEIGEHVSADQPLVKLDDSVEKAKVAQLKAQAEDTTEIEAAQAKLDQSKVDLEKIEAAWNADPQRRAVTEFELDHARLQVEIARLSLKLQEFRHEQHQRQYREAQLQLERMQLTSPIDGTVEFIFVEVGESVDALQEVIRVVNVDPLWIDVPVSLDHAEKLSVGDPARVAFDQPQAEAAEGTVIHVASVADAASNTLPVRVELANPSSRPAGQRVFVSFALSTSENSDSTQPPVNETENEEPQVIAESNTLQQEEKE